MIILAVALLAGRSGDPPTAQDVRQSIHEVALARPGSGSGTRTTPGGVLGPWWISAGALDGDRLLDFKVDAGSVQVSARSARVVVDGHTDTICFDLSEVVVARVDGEGAGGTLERLERYQLGPIPYGRDIRPDPLLDE